MRPTSPRSRRRSTSSNTEGNLKGTWKGILRFDGARLHVCDNAPDMAKPRPSAFAAPAGSGYVSIVFARDGS